LSKVRGARPSLTCSRAGGAVPPCGTGEGSTHRGWPSALRLREQGSGLYWPCSAGTVTLLEAQLRCRCRAERVPCRVEGSLDRSGGLVGSDLRLRSASNSSSSTHIHMDRLRVELLSLEVTGDRQVLDGHLHRLPHALQVREVASRTHSPRWTRDRTGSRAVGDIHHCRTRSTLRRSYSLLAVRGTVNVAMARASARGACNRSSRRREHATHDAKETAIGVQANVVPISFQDRIPNMRPRRGGGEYGRNRRRESDSSRHDTRPRGADFRGRKRDGKGARYTKVSPHDAAGEPVLDEGFLARVAGFEQQHLSILNLDALHDRARGSESLLHNAGALMTSERTTSRSEHITDGRPRDLEQLRQCRAARSPGKPEPAWERETKHCRSNTTIHNKAAIGCGHPRQPGDTDTTAEAFKRCGMARTDITN